MHKLELANGTDPAARSFAQEVLIFHSYEMGLRDAQLADWGRGPALGVLTLQHGVGAGADREGAEQLVEGLADGVGVGVGAEVLVALPLLAPHHHRPGPLVGASDGEERVGLVVDQLDVEPGAVLLDERVLEHQGGDFGLSEDPVDGPGVVDHDRLAKEDPAHGIPDRKREADDRPRADQDADVHPQPQRRFARVMLGCRQHDLAGEDAVADLRARFPGLDVVLIESGGDNLAATFSPELADITIYVIDVSAGDKIPRKGGPGITRSDLLVINKIDLAPLVGADLSVMDADTRRMRGTRPYVFANLKAGDGLGAIIAFLETQAQPWLFVHQILTGWTALVLLWAAATFIGIGRWRPIYAAAPLFPLVWSYVAIW